MGLIKTILIILIIYYGAKFFVKYIAPVLLVNYIKKKTGQQVKNEPLEKEGTITIDKKPNSNNAVKDNVGEYVDYEEVD